MSLPIPAAALAQHVIVLGKTRSGKSSTLRLIVEKLLGDGKPVSILDPKGDWWGLKSSADGRSAGFPVVIFGGDHADVPINAHAGAYVGELVATGNRPSIVDLGGWTIADRTRFFIDFAAALFRYARGPRWLCIDEAHNFAPQGKVLDPQAGQMLHWANRLASEGAGKGLTLLSASQRPQKVHKDFVTSHETLIAMRVIHPLDRRAIEDWISGCPDAAKGREVLTTLAGMKRGQGWVWSPEIAFGPACIQFPLFSTYDSFAAPTGDAMAKLKGWATVDLEEVKAKLAAVVAEAKANDPRELRAEIAALKRELAKKVDGAGDAALREEIARLGQEIIVEREQAKVSKEMAFESGFNRAATQIQTLIRDMLAGDPGKAPENPLFFASAFSRSMIAPTATVEREPASVKAPTPQMESRLDLGPERRILAALARCHPAAMTEAQWAVAAGMKRSGGTWGTYKSRLRSAGAIELDGAGWRATEAGLAALGEIGASMPAPGPDLVAFWADRLSGVRPMLTVLAERYPRFIARDALAAELDMAAAGGTFGTYLSRLRSTGLIEERRGEGLRAAPALMEG